MAWIHSFWIYMVFPPDNRETTVLNLWTVVDIRRILGQEGGRDKEKSCGGLAAAEVLCRGRKEQIDEEELGLSYANYKKHGFFGISSNIDGFKHSKGVE